MSCGTRDKYGDLQTCLVPRPCQVDSTTSYGAVRKSPTQTAAENWYLSVVVSRGVGMPPAICFPKPQSRRMSAEL
jgi:hypothetical protein